ncbi:TIFY domain/Divergent CCT motif family protein [Perilla frutescens var. hirtella]|nr:TIFY domain/Divergent CCT motif family protein [Perilla frutescens var. hirtella]
MEIDFLGLNSPKYNLEQENSKTPFIDTAGGVEISLSLSSSSSLNFSEKKKWEFAACDKMISSSCSGSTVCSFAPYNQENCHKTEQPSLLLVAPPLFRHPAAAGFLYDLNDAATTNLRNMPQLYAACPTVFSEPEKAENSVYAAGNASTCGYTPTVAMARRATLARFLEKRLHRMNQARATHLMGKSLRPTISEAM